MHTALYVIWFLIPTFFLLMALWAFLEKLSGKELKEGGIDSFKQGIFVLACVLISVAIDQTVLPDIVASIGSDWLPLGFFQALLLPAVLYAVALIYGPSKTIRISKAPKPSQAKRKR